MNRADPKAFPGAGEAAVLVLFRFHRLRPEVLLIRRAIRDGDPWSGHVAFPGGRRDPSDPDLSQTALRETLEEVGLAATALEGAPRCWGVQSPANRPGVRVGVFLGVLRDGLDPAVQAGPEVSDSFWVPLDRFHRGHRRVPVAGVDGGIEVEGFDFPQGFVWGFTYRVLHEVLSAHRSDLG